MNYSKVLASQNAIENQIKVETRNEDFFEIDIMEELKFEYDECEESELSKLLLNL